MSNNNDAIAREKCVNLSKDWVQKDLNKHIETGVPQTHQVNSTSIHVSLLFLKISSSVYLNVYILRNKVSFRIRSVSVYRLLQNYLILCDVLKLGQQFFLDCWDALVPCRWHQAEVCFQQLEVWNLFGSHLCPPSVAEGLIQLLHVVLIALRMDAERRRWLAGPSACSQLNADVHLSARGGHKDPSALVREPPGCCLKRCLTIVLHEFPWSFFKTRDKSLRNASPSPLRYLAC